MHPFILDEEVQAKYEVSQKELPNAYCWTTLNQGLGRKGRASPL